MSAGEPVPGAAEAPSQDALRFLIASRWRRVCASQVDFWSTFVLGFAALSPVLLTTPVTEGVMFLLFLPLWVAASYFVSAVPLSRSGERNGQTLGMQLLQVRIVRADGHPIAYGWREPGRLADLVLYQLPSLRLYRLIDDDWGLLTNPDAQERLDATGPLFAVRADVRRLPGLPPPPPGRK